MSECSECLRDDCGLWLVKEDGEYEESLMCGECISFTDLWHLVDDLDPVEDEEANA